MSQKQILIDGVLYDLTPVQQDSVNHTSAVNTRYEPAAAAEPKGKEWEILNYDFIKYPETKTVDMKDPRVIHSVRRLSDNEVFAVGEKVRHFGEIDVIKSFEINSGYACGLWVVYENEQGGRTNFMHIHKYPARTPLFTTTDGKPVYEGETFWYVAPDMYLGSFFSNGSKLGKLIESHKTFSTKAAAEQWIADNKPLYSLNDIQKALHGEWGTQNAVDNVLNRIKNSKK